MSFQVNYLQASGYIFDTKLKIWLRSEYPGISYSDGEETELRIASIINQASDITVLSTELRQHCTDWPTLYHLSGTRANILRPFAASFTGDILEIGSGCGAITRYLGECGANILALEGSPRRATITRSRTRDLKNVTVLTEKFDQFQCDRRFDVITLIGVLEYANLFTTSESPALAMLQRVRSLLKPEGKLIIAIENQLGLKYFAGAPEDHLGQPMYGIEGRYKTDQPQTFGRATIAELLAEAGFANAEFLAPFPDYKLPVSILTQEGLSNKRFDGAALAWQSVRRDPQLPSSTNFLLELAWPEVFNNGLALDMANSFLIVASSLQQQVIKPGILGYHYSTDRIPQYCKEIVFEYFDEHVMGVNYHLLGGNHSNDKPDQIIKFECPERAVYAEGIPLSLEFIKIVTREDWSIEEVGAFIRRYINLLSLVTGEKADSIVSLQLTDKLPGDFFDMVPQNIIVSYSGQPFVIDTEWALNGDIELGWLLFRTLLLAIESVACFGRNSTGHTYSRREFIKSALYSAGYLLSDDNFLRFIKLESDIQRQVSGRTSQGLLYSWSEQMLPAFSIAKHDKRVLNLSQIIAERNEQIVNLNQILINHSNSIAGLSQVIAQQNEQIVNLNQTVIEYNNCIAKLEFEPESTIQREISEHTSQDLSNSQSGQMPTSSFVTQCDRRVAYLNQVLGERDKQIASLNQTVIECNNRIARLQYQFEDQIVEIHASTSWRLTSPIRATKSILITLGIHAKQGALAGIIRSAGFNNLLRRVYKNFPLPLTVKQRLKEIYLHQSGTFNQSDNSNQSDNPGIANENTFQLDANRETLPMIAASAKQFDPNDPWVLVVDLRTPTPDQDSGSVRMSAIIRLLREMGFRITFISDSEERLPHYQEVLERQSIDVLHGFDAARSHLATIGGKYHFVLLSRPEVAFQYLPYVRAYALYATIIYDTVDLHWVRFEREMQISGDRALLDVIAHFRRLELFNTACADLVLAITDEEKNRLLIEQPDAKVTVLPNIHEPCPPRTSFDQRKDLLFIGGFWHKPNEDAVIYFVKDILPRIIEKIPDLVFYIIGSNMPMSIKSLHSANVEPLGFVADVVPYFESCRIFVAPLRFGAGMKGKVGQSMSHGLPVITTQIGAEGMGLHHGKHVLIATNPQDFADAVVQLYSNEPLWRNLSAESLAYLAANYSLAATQKRMARIFTRTQNEYSLTECQEDGVAITACAVSSL
ncbi:Glycosyltransferase involved in cell wall bisynthesis [Nitrosospira sp. Nsp13]|nr:Glycosyltransferase involved in cell wall bisynthesis [Nitrosospira sp. Nsp13]